MGYHSTRDSPREKDTMRKSTKIFKTSLPSWWTSLAVLLLSSVYFRSTIYEWWTYSDGHSIRTKYRLYSAPHLPTNVPTRNLTWADIQFLHTTDIHGWFTPHHSQSLNSYSADWADWISFIEQMKAKAASEGRDLVVVDTGDLITGHGLSDGSPDTNDASGKYSNEIFSRANYDIVTIGNHELYSFEALQEMRRSFIPSFEGRYLTSNVNMTDEDNVSKPLGSLYHSMVLPQTGLRMTSIGFVFNLTPVHPDRVQTQPPMEMFNTNWFTDLLSSDVARDTDLWLLAGHMPLDGPEDEWNAMVTRLRTYTNIGSKPIVGLAGHTHIRNCRQADPLSVVLQSGRFHETAGWLSYDIASQNFSRRYIDLNPINLAHHLGKSKFHLTNTGMSVRNYIANLTSSWHLNEVHGISPRTFHLDSYPSNHSSSILQGVNEILQRVFTNNDTLVVLNAASMRSDIHKGPFTTNDQYIVSPFDDEFYVLNGVAVDLARRVFGLLNPGQPYSTKEGELGKERSYSQIYPVLPIDEATDQETQEERIGRKDTIAMGTRSEGYATVDECGVDGRDGDDTEHVPIPVHPFEPNYIGFLTESNLTTTVDIITVKYLIPRIVNVLNGLPANQTWSASQAQVYRDPMRGTIKTRDLWKIQAEEMWEQPNGDIR
ncbi:unnamed protein product [Sympodiomycopsis kandeliae]